MINFDYGNFDIAKKWLLRLFEDKQLYTSAIYKSGIFMEDAIIKYPNDPYATTPIYEEQFREVFSAFEDDEVLVVTNFHYLLKPEHFAEGVTKDYFTSCPTTQAFAISKNLFDYRTYLEIESQFCWIAYIDQESGRTLISLAELNFLIYP